MLQYLFRFLMGGMIVSLFASLGDVLKPKSFAGLFGAAPSVALATLGSQFWLRERRMPLSTPDPWSSELHPSLHTRRSVPG